MKGGGGREIPAPYQKRGNELPIQNIFKTMRAAMFSDIQCVNSNQRILIV